MIRRRCPADSPPGSGNDARRSSIARSRRAWIDAVVDSLATTGPATAAVIVAPLTVCPVFTPDLPRTAMGNRERNEYRVPAARVESPGGDHLSWHLSRAGSWQ